MTATWVSIVLTAMPEDFGQLELASVSWPLPWSLADTTQRGESFLLSVITLKKTVCSSVGWTAE